MRIGYSGMTEALQLVSCERRALRLTAAGCVRLFEDANAVDPPPAWASCASCRHCKTGASRAGVNVEPFGAALETLDKICVRCRRANNRLILRQLCPSCYNRDREVACGRNGRGSPPIVVAKTLYPIRAILVRGTSAEPIEPQRAGGVLELLLGAVRKIRGPAAIGWAAPT